MENNIISIGKASVNIKELEKLSKEDFFSTLKGKVDQDLNLLWKKYGTKKIEVNAEVGKLTKKNRGNK